MRSLPERVDGPAEQADMPTAKLLALAAESYQLRSRHGHPVAYLAYNQRHDGSWWFGGVSRAPLEKGRWHGPPWRIRGMLVFGHAGLKADLDRRIARAAIFLANAKARHQR